MTTTIKGGVASLMLTFEIFIAGEFKLCIVLCYLFPSTSTWYYVGCRAAGSLHQVELVTHKLQPYHGWTEFHGGKFRIQVTKYSESLAETLIQFPRNKQRFTSLFPLVSFFSNSISLLSHHVEKSWWIIILLSPTETLLLCQEFCLPKTF